MAADGLTVEACCRVLEVPVSGYFAWRSRPPSQRSLRHAWLTERIRAVHVASRGTYGAARVHADLRLGHGIIVGHNAVELLMRRAASKAYPHTNIIVRYTKHRPRATSSTATSAGRHPTSCGSPTSPNIPPVKARSTARSCSTATPEGCRLVHRRDPDLSTGHPRTEHGHQQPQTRPCHRHTLRPRKTRIELANAIFDYPEPDAPA